MSAGSLPRLLVGGIGYRNLRDHSAGVLLSDRLAARAWPGHVTVEDLSYNPVAVAQRLEDGLEGAPIDRVILVAAVARGRPPGSTCSYRWDGRLPTADRIQDAVGEAVTGVISLDNTLIVTRQFGALPADVVVVEIEPAVESFGDELTPSVAEALERGLGIVDRLVDDPDAFLRIPVAPLGGGALPSLRVP